MRYLILFLFLSSVFFVSNAQPIESTEYNQLVYDNALTFSEIEYKDIQGNPYSNESLIPGTIAFSSGKKIDGIPLRYDWYSKTMQYKPEEELMQISETKGISYIEINGVKYVPFYYIKSVQGFLIELFQGKYGLYREDEVFFIDAKPPQSGYDDAQPAKFQHGRSNYFAIYDDGKIIHLDLNKNRLPLQFPGLEDKITSFMKQEKISLKSEEDLIKLIQELNKWL